jgi:hypothetical protein
VATALLIIGAVAAVRAPAAPGLKISINATPKVLQYGQPAPQSSRIRGYVSTEKRGIKVSLLAQAWPFAAAPRVVATTKTRRGGIYVFKPKPSVATRYHVTATSLGARSQTRTVFVMPGYKNLTCTISGPGQSLPCARAEGAIPAGTYTVRFGFDALYPPSAYATEKAKPPYVYYAQRNGSERPPRSLSLQGRTHQQAGAGTSTRINVVRSITVPNGAWVFYVVACTQTSAQSDGIGLPVATGSHHCGDSAISLREAMSVTLG